MHKMLSTPTLVKPKELDRYR